MLAAVAMLAGVVAPLAVMAAPARAGTSMVICFKIDGILYCYDIPVAVCDFCPDPEVGIITNPVLPPEEQGWVRDLGAGMTLIGQAANTADPRLAAALHDRAQATLAGIIPDIAGTQFRLGEDPTPEPWVQALSEDPQPEPWAQGLSDEPRPDPWVQAFGEHVVTGLNLLAAAPSSRDPWAATARALTEFDLAYDELANA
jgi:hypothetical protein